MTTVSNCVLGYAVYMEPQVGRVEMTLEQAQQQGIAAREVTLADGSHHPQH